MSWKGEPVVVIGNGPVGQTAALLLAHWDIPTVVLDQRPRRDPVGSKAICQQRDVLDVWAAVGVGERVAAEGVTWTTARTFHRDRELFSYAVTDPGQAAFPPFVNLSQSRTEELLDEAIAAEPRIEVCWDHRVTGLTQDADGVTVRCGEFVTHAPYALVCAGARCDVLRESLGVTFEGHSFDDRFLIADIRADLPGWASERRFYFDPVWNPGRQVLIHPCPDSTFRIDWQVPPDYDLDTEVASGALNGRIRAIIGAATDYEIVWTSVYRFHSRCADRLRTGRVLLAGDAAHLVSPFGARGLNSGVGDAENAAWKLAYVLHGWAPEELLETYHDERRAAAIENLAVTTATMDFLVPPDPERAARRADLLARAVENPEARASVDSGRLAEPFWYVDSPLTTPYPGRPFAGRPHRGATPSPAPGVLLPDASVTVTTDGPEVSLRRLARDGFLLLSTNGLSTANGSDQVSASAIDGPIRHLSLPAIDPAGALTALLGARAGEVWIVRPDAHIAATVPPGPAQPAEIAAALRRACGRPEYGARRNRRQKGGAYHPDRRSWSRDTRPDGSGR